MRYYKITFIGVGLLAALCLVGFLLTLSYNEQQRIQFQQLQGDMQESLIAKAQAEGEQRVEEEKNRPLRSFLSAWMNQAKPAGPKELGLYVRGALTSEADKLSLAYDGVTVPSEPAKFVLGSGNRTLLAQKNSIIVTSESLPTLITWLGQVEQALPYARIEYAALSAYGSRSVQLAVTMYYPIEDDGSKLTSSIPAY